MSSGGVEGCAVGSVDSRFSIGAWVLGFSLIPRLLREVFEELRNMPVLCTGPMQVLLVMGTILMLSRWEGC